MSETESCGAPGCSRPAAGTVELRPLCLEHFLTSCYAKLDRCAQQLREQPLEKSTVELMQQFVKSPRGRPPTSLTPWMTWTTCSARGCSTSCSGPAN